MQDILTVSNMRRSDAAAIAAGTPGEELMRRAGEGIYRAVAAWPGPVAIVCGTGNNAGDGYVVALRMREAGIPCELLLPETRFSPDGRRWFDRCAAAGVPVRLWADVPSLAGYGSIVDCIFGTGFHGEPTGEAAEMIRRINESGAFVVSADINSGLNGDNGLAALAVRSDLTVSVGSLKPGHFLNMAKDYRKRVVNCNIGIPPADRPLHLAEAADLAPLFPPRPQYSHKGDYGYIALIGGSMRYSGAIRLARLSAAAMRAGAGVVRLCAPRSLCPALVPEVLETTLYPLSDTEGNLHFVPEEFEEALAHTKAAAFGMGAELTAETEKIVDALLSTYDRPLILDADGLNALSRIGAQCLKDAAGPVLLTPHLGEFSRLSGTPIPEIQADPVVHAERFAAEYGATLLLKGPATLITDGQETLIVDRGCPGMATAGSGDVLSGILAALLASHPEDPLLTAAAGAWINGRAGELAQEKYGDISMTAGDTAETIPRVIRELRETSMI